MKSEKKAASAAKPSIKSAEVKSAGSKSAEAKSAKTKAVLAKPARKSPVPAKAATAAKTKPAPAEAQKVPATPAKKKAAAKPKASLKASQSADEGTERILDSKVVYEGPLFRVLQDHFVEPNGREARRDIIRHNGSVVILAVDPAKHKKDPWIVIERQYRHAAGQYLWELPAGKLDAGETPIEGAKRELAEETGYSAKKWSPLVEYYASPGFLGEAMKVFLAEGLVAGDAHPEEDEHIDFRLVKLSEVLEMVDKGKIVDGKTLTTILLYARRLGIKRKK